TISVSIDIQPIPSLSFDCTNTGSNCTTDQLTGNATATANFTTGQVKSAPESFTLSLRQLGGGTDTVNLASDSAWLSVNPVTTALGLQAITISIDPTKLTAPQLALASVTGKITATGLGGEKATFTVTLNIAPTP